MENLEKIVSTTEMVVQYILRSRQSIRDKIHSKKISKKFDYNKQAMQSEVDNLNPANDDKAELEEICVTTKSLF